MPTVLAEKLKKLRLVCNPKCFLARSSAYARRRWRPAMIGLRTRLPSCRNKRENAGLWPLRTSRLLVMISLRRMPAHPIIGFRQGRTLSIVIPTKNRPDDLGEAVQSILSQTVLPTQLIIVDQSATEESRQRVKATWDAASLSTHGPAVDLIYIHDTSITGAATRAIARWSWLPPRWSCFSMTMLNLNRPLLRKSSRPIVSPRTLRAFPVL